MHVCVPTGIVGGVTSSIDDAYSENLRSWFSFFLFTSVASDVVLCGGVRWNFHTSTTSLQHIAMYTDGGWS